MLTSFLKVAPIDIYSFVWSFSVFFLPSKRWARDWCHCWVHARLNRLETHLERQAELSVRSSMAKDPKTPCFFFFFREAWDGIYFFGGWCQFLKMNNLRGKEVILKDDSKWGLELTARIGYGNDRIFPPVWHFWVDDLPAFPTWDTVDGRNPAPPGMYKTIVNNKINYHIKWCRISESSTVCLSMLDPWRVFEFFFLRYLSDFSWTPTPWVAKKSLQRCDPKTTGEVVSETFRHYQSFVYIYIFIEKYTSENYHGKSNREWRCISYYEELGGSPPACASWDAFLK